MSPVLTALVAMQRLDTAAELARRRLQEMPLAEREAEARVAAAEAAMSAAKGRLAENQKARRDLEKQVAEVDTRLSRFEDHKAAVKTNQEFTALLSEITTAKGSKDGLEEQILLLLEEADGISDDIRGAERALADARQATADLRAAMAVERQTLETDLARLSDERAREAVLLPAPVLAKYEQILKQRRMVAVAPVEGEICAGCHVRLRPAVTQQVRRNDEIIQCDSCQRILYFIPKPAPVAEA